MTGLVLAHHALLSIPIRALDSADADFLEVEFIIDTGFVGDLTLPLAAVKALKLPYSRRSVANLANNAAVPVSVFDAEVLWQKAVKRVEVLVLELEPLLGTLLLDGCELNIRFADNEIVTVNSL